MRLYLMRHATAVPRGTRGYPQDGQRPLTPEGIEQARQVAEGLKRLNLKIECLAVSPYVRAMQTAEQIRRVLGDRLPVQPLDTLRAESKPSETSAALAGLKHYDRLLLIGHEPHLSAWVAELVAGPSGNRCILKKGGVACVEIKRVPPLAGQGTLRWLLTPKQLALIGRSR